MKAFIVDMFYSRIQGRDAITAAGRLENGKTFGFVDYRIEAVLYVRKSDEFEVRKHLPNSYFVLTPSTRSTMDGEAVISLRAPNLFELRNINKLLLERGVRTYEGDLDFGTRYRIANGIKLTVDIQGEALTSKHVDKLFINPTLTPADGDFPLKVLSLDIETDHAASQILGFSFVSWTLGGECHEEVHILGEDRAGDPAYLTAYESEKELLNAFQTRLLAIDPDIVTGWNVIDFDLYVLEKLATQYDLPFTLGRTKETSRYKKGQFFGKSRLIMQGRQVLDALALARHTLFNFDDLRLGTVAKALLGRGKTLHVEEWQDAAAVIREAYENDRTAFAEYVLEDARLVKDILDNQRLIELTTARSQLTSLPLERAWGSIAAFEALYIAELNKRNIAAPTLGVDLKFEGSGTGGLVLTPKVGLHSHVLIFDFKSLYPSVMRTFNIDPLSYVHGHLLKSKNRMNELIVAPGDIAFDREPGILPKLLDEFTAQREAAKKLGDSLGSYTYKIIMNSFYGVLATDACRFADMKLADAITGFGQFLLVEMQTYFEDQGLNVLYGDTDSLFVQVDALQGSTSDEAWTYGQILCAKANRFLAERIQTDYQLESKMELEFEKYFRYCFLPPDRQGDSGRAKNYAGLNISGGKEKLVITGLEAVRSDWTPFARSLQRELLDRLFHEATPESMVSYIRARLKDMFRGACDEELIYRKRIRRPLDSYTKTTPPHIRAARLLPRPVRVVRYLMTENGPEPMGFVKSKILYDHYLEKQIRPIIENLAPYAGFEAEDALDRTSGLKFSGTLS